MFIPLFWIHEIHGLLIQLVDSMGLIERSSHDQQQIRRLRNCNCTKKTHWIGRGIPTRTAATFFDGHFILRGTSQAFYFLLLVVECYVILRSKINRLLIWFCIYSRFYLVHCWGSSVRMPKILGCTRDDCSTFHNFSTQLLSYRIASALFCWSMIIYWTLFIGVCCETLVWYHMFCFLLLFSPTCRFFHLSPIW